MTLHNTKNEAKAAMILDRFLEPMWQLTGRLVTGLEANTRRTLKAVAVDAIPFFKRVREPRDS